MLEEMEFSPELLRQMEPPADVIVQDAEPIDRPVNYSEQMLSVATILCLSLAKVIPWTPFHIIGDVAGVGLLAITLLNLCIPPRFSRIRFGYLFTIIVLIITNFH